MIKFVLIGCKYLLEREISMVKKKIFIRLGHDILKNGRCTAAKGILEEYSVIREYGKELAIALKNHFEVKIFDSYPGTYSNSSEALTAGVSEANKWNADLFISCHANSFNGAANGTEVCCWFGDERSKKIATDISGTISTFLNTRNRGPKDRLDLYEIKETKMSAIIIEPIFIDNQNDCFKYTNSNNNLFAKKLTEIIVQNLK